MNVVLTGMMGTGKTSVGRIVAARLGREFVDLDEWVAAREQMSLAEIFAQKGEAYFRAREREAVNECARRDDLVIATGGGTLVDSQNRTAFASALVVCLDAEVEEIARRLDGANDRPLLAHTDRKTRLAELLATRREAYAAIPNHISTNGRTIDQVAEQVMAITDSRSPITLSVKQPNGAYPIHIGRGLLERAGELVRLTLENFSRAALVTNPTVGALYAERVASSFRASGIELCVIEIPDGEEYKTLDSARRVYDALIDARLDRHAPILALGGGVIGDLAGLVAATYLRGVPFVQIPTSLLAMVDASIGGKVAVNHPRGKNLIGAFKTPHAVIVDADVLHSLPEAEYRAGLAEVVKHALIGDAKLFERLEIATEGSPVGRNWRLEIGDVARAMQVKIRIVEQDPFEENIRAHLNLGHTFAHALERVSNFRMRHGEAVAIGLACACALARARDLLDASVEQRVIHILEKFGLPTRVPRAFDADQVIEAMQTDKKRAGDRLRFVLPRALGAVDVFGDVTRAELRKVLDTDEHR